MKKLLLTMLAVVASTAMFAQLQRVEGLEKVNLSQRLKESVAAPAQLCTAEQMRAASRKEKSENIDFTCFAKPSGGLYAEMDKDGYGYYPTLLFMPAFYDYEFKNLSPNPTSCIWTINDYDYTEYADAEGDFWWDILPADGLWSAPVLWNSTKRESYAIPSYYEDSGYPTYLANFPYLAWVGWFIPYYNYGYGSLDNHNLMGTGTYTTGGVKYVCTTVVEDFPKPMSAFYLEELFFYGRSLSNEPLKNGKELALKIYDITNPNSPVLKETLTATADDWEGWYEGERSYGGGMFGALSFSKKEEDPLFGTTIAPVTIDYPSEWVIDGFESDDIDFGFNLQEAFDCDQDLTDAYLVIENPDDASDAYMLHYGDAGFFVSMNGIMDMAVVADTLTWTYNGETMATVAGYNVIIISDDGQECYNDVPEDWALFTDGTGAVYADITCPWFDEDNSSIENYYFTNVPDWVTGILVDDEYYDPDNYSYEVYVKFVAEALPSGTTYRAATTYLHGRGYQADVPIYLLQGDIPEGIESIPAAAATSSTSKGTYNLAGQRVSDSAKGILVRDGKKFINK